MNALSQLTPLIAANASAFKQPGVLTVRPGYRMKNDWLTNEPAIVVVTSPGTSPSGLPSEIGGVPVEVRPATPVESLRHDDPSLYAAVAVERPEFRGAAFDELRPDSGAVEEAGGLGPGVLAAKPRLPYTAPAGASLKPVTGNFTMTCHASPDAGWPTLREFLKGVSSSLTVGLYDFTSKHILDEVADALDGNKQLTLTLDNPAKNPTADQTDKQTRHALEKKLGDSFSAAWALNRMNKEIPRWVYPTAYHIKVAVRDSKAFWLSSGNWNNSNQPDFDPIGAPSADDQKTARDSDRDWHVVVDHPGLAKTYEEYLQHDFDVASAEQGGPAPAGAGLEVALPFDFRLAAQGTWQFHAPLSLTNEPATITPLLTPDPGIYRDAMLALIQRCTDRLYIQLQYIHPSDNEDDDPFMDLLNAVVKKIDDGRDVKIITSQWQKTNGWLERLQAAGVPSEVLKIQNGVHNKGFVIDGTVVALGSQNWSGDGVLRNRDASLIIENAKAAQYFEKIFLHDWTRIARQSVA